MDFILDNMIMILRRMFGVFLRRRKINSRAFAIIFEQASSA